MLFRVQRFPVFTDKPKRDFDSLCVCSSMTSTEFFSVEAQGPAIQPKAAHQELIPQQTAPPFVLSFSLSIRKPIRLQTVAAVQW